MLETIRSTASASCGSPLSWTVARSGRNLKVSTGGRTWELAAESDRGPVLPENQDAWLLLPLEERGAQ